VREHRVAEPVEAEIHCKDGMVRSIDVFGTVMGDKLLAIFSDLTDRKKAEKEREMLLSDIRQALEAVTRSQKEWQETFDNITDMISIHDKNFNIIRANKAFSENLGLHPRDVIGRKCYELMHHGALSPIAACPHERSLMDRTLAAEEVHDEMTGRTLQVTTYPYVAPDGELIGSIHIARDITEEKEREMKMIMTERLASLGQMASGIAHEINNPLSSVMMCAEMLLMQVAKDRYDHAQFERYLKTIDEEVQRCRDITTSMLSFARQTSMEKQDVDLQLLLDKTVDLVGFQGRLKNVQVVKRYGPKVLVKGSEGELRQVMLVLVVNALDAMKNKGTLTIATERTDEMCRVHVGDSGPGIPEEVRQKIFQPFFTTKTDSGGTGLGLAIAHRIMTNHQGSIEVSSEPGAGATFVVSLPCR
jgi:PAS domain S-box-containing protein